MINFSLSYEKFKYEFFEKKPLVIKGAIRNKDLLSWNEINEIFPRCKLIGEEEIKVMYKGKKVPKEYYVESYNDLGTLRYKFKEEELYCLMRDGATLIANGIVNEPAIDIFSQEIAKFTKCHIFSSLYVAFNTQRSFKIHWDSRDIFAIQMQGGKRWIIHSPTFKDPLFMHRSKDMPEYFPNKDDVYIDILLEAGDILYLPRGWWHDPIPVGEETVHLAVGVFPPYTNDYLSWVTENIVKNEIARKSLSSSEKNDEIISLLSAEVADFINNKDNFNIFLESFYDKKRIEKSLNLEIFANHNFSEFKGNEKISFPIKNDYYMKSNKVISNGYKISIEGKFKEILDCLYFSDLKSLEDLLLLAKENDRRDIKDLIWKLSFLGVLKIDN
ncbi:cupin domain-containing protein [Actinobacillus pleuropneumoniae]|uniref:cupin domain-containing protein n=1 Tax=Actinobacillus pleuropneumoniae TaxID=715 RepID=UPI0020791E2D|nr:cupin domain-containing protein [Actinobacillus pleuropneumoniae]